MELSLYYLLFHAEYERFSQYLHMLKYHLLFSSGHYFYINMMIYSFSLTFCVDVEIMWGGVHEVGLVIACFNLISNGKVSIFFLANLLCRCKVVGGGVYEVGLAIACFNLK